MIKKIDDIINIFSTQKRIFLKSFSTFLNSYFHCFVLISQKSFLIINKFDGFIININVRKIIMRFLIYIILTVIIKKILTLFFIFFLEQCYNALAAVAGQTYLYSLFRSNKSFNIFSSLLYLDVNVFFIRFFL